MAPPMHTADAILFLFLLLLLAPTGDKTPPTSSTAKPLDQATSALPMGFVQSGSPSTCSKSLGDHLAHPAIVHPVIPTSEGTCFAPPTNSAVDQAIINGASSAPALVSTGNEPSSSLLFVPISANNRTCSPPRSTDASHRPGGKLCSSHLFNSKSRGPCFSTIDHFPQPPKSGGLPSSSTLYPGGDKAYLCDDHRNPCFPYPFPPPHI